jgi:predicted regulator of Ras-like GTPase activity (Roadblock/LC7/MglB family)
MGSDALASLRGADFDLTIVDMDLDPGDMPYDALVRSVREILPEMRVVLIPLMGEEVPSEARVLDIQGTLSKPFFADDLLPNIQEALRKRVVAAPAPPRPEPQPQPQQAMHLPEERSASGVEDVLSELARETNADAAVLVSTATGSQEIVAQVGTQAGIDVEMLAKLCVATIQAARAVARALGQPNALFEHNIFEGETFRLYILGLAPDLLLIVVVPVTTPLGTIRYNLGRLRRDLAGLPLT